MHAGGKATAGWQIRPELASVCSQLGSQVGATAVGGALITCLHWLYATLFLSCSGVYWQGNQYGRAVQQMTDLIADLAV
jgi:hypothetical protein